MGRRALLAFFLSLLVIIGYNHFVAKKYPVQVRGPGLQLEERVTPAPLTLPRPLSSRPQERDTFPVKITEQAKEVIVQTDLVELVITSSGARIKSCRLKDYPEERIEVDTIEKQLVQINQALTQALPEKKKFLYREQAKLELLLEKSRQKPRAVELVSLPAAIDADFSPALILPDDEDVSIALNTALYDCSQEGLTLNEGRPEGQLEFTYTDTLGRRVKKRFTFSNSNYSIGLDISFQGWQRHDLAEGHFFVSCGPDVGLPQARRERRAQAYQGPVTYFLTNGNGQGWIKKEKYTRRENNVFTRREHLGRVVWSGLGNKYFLTALIPAQPAQSVVVERNKFGEQKVALRVPWEGTGPYNFQLYLGPKKGEQLKQIGVTLEKTIDYGFFGPIARFIYQILLFFSRWTNNFGWAIVLLCFVVKIVFYPLTHRSFESMQKMQHEMKSVQPEMEALREKFKANPQKLNKEIMGLYRRRGINPMASCQSGCLPLVLQMPVFFALYAVLYNSIELRGAPFLGWVQDLSAKDPYYILPILMGISMFVQQKLTGIGGTGGAQQEQAKMMGYLMPVFLTWIFASLPAGVVLYWLTFNTLTALQQLLIRKKQEVVTA